MLWCRWSFKLYDEDNSGSIALEEMEKVDCFLLQGDALLTGDAVHLYDYYHFHCAGFGPGPVVGHHHKDPCEEGTETILVKKCHLEPDKRCSSEEVVVGSKVIKMAMLSKYMRNDNPRSYL